jgi:oxygen-independent coproporphyrinogen-3 oxidase
MSPTQTAPTPIAVRGRAPEGTPLYVHLPFCAAKCHYCDFFSVAAHGHDRAANVAAILREAEIYAPSRPRTVFVGGGTPSLLSAGELKVLFDGLQRITGFRDAAVEVTAECNPESLDRDKARALLDLGVTRLSIGFQSLHDEVLKLFGRVHSVAQSFEAYDAARSAGATDVNVDMIYAVPDQSAEQWGRDLQRVIDLRPDHLSAYNLTFEEDTVFRRWLDQGKLAKAPEDVELELFDLTRTLASRAGLEAYEISNFARSGRQCLHNVNYWENGRYLGIGPSAVSKVGSTRGGNLKAVGAYEQSIRNAGDARTWEETPDARERLLETWWLGLRLKEGISAKEARARSGFEGAPDPAERIAARLVADGLLEEVDGRFRLTPRGLPLGDYVARRFLTAAT